MLVEVTLENFKCFKNSTVFPTSKLNVLTGINSRGKSTFLQPLLLFAQTVRKDSTASGIFLNGPLTRLGSFNDIKNVDSRPEVSIRIKFGIENRGLDLEIDYELGRDNAVDWYSIEDDGFARIRSVATSLNGSVVQVHDLTAGFELLMDLQPDLSGQLKKEQLELAHSSMIRYQDLHYVSASRIGPESFHSSESQGSFFTVGPRGERTVDLIHKFRDIPAQSALVLEAGSPYLIPDQLSAWITFVFNGGKASVKSIDSTLLRLELNSDGTNVYFKPENIGFGVSYTLPILVAGLIARPGEILIVENPESHLHPAAQSRLAQFLATVAHGGVQVFLETHSQHVLNGARIALKKGVVSSDDLNVLYFQSEADCPVRKIVVDPDGRIEHWPEGFFDQNEIDIEILHGIRD